MTRMHLNTILTMAIVMFFGSAFTGCGVDNDFASSQRTNIEAYLSANSLTATITADSVFVVLAGSFPTPPAEKAERGDSVVFNFASYTFSSRPAAAPFYTNKYWLAVTIPNNPNLDYWNFNPIRTKLGNGEIIKGIESALLSCRRGDSLVAFITSNLAYGSQAMGTVPANTALMTVLTVDDVIKE